MRNIVNPLPLSAQQNNTQIVISPQPLYSALTTFAEQSGIQFVYDAALVKGLTSSGVAQEQDTGKALTRLLLNSGISYRFTDANTVVLYRADKQPDDDGADAALLPVGSGNRKLKVQR
jgi:iron complex outermembrane receptor protein